MPWTRSGNDNLNTKGSLPRSILFVDDEDKARKYFALALADEFDVLTAGSADEALELLGRDGQSVAIVISDQRMPEKPGVELLKTVREVFPHIVRLLTTAYTDIDDAIAAINRGEILRYIQKPWDINTLRSELRQAMNYFQLRHERDCLLEEKLTVRQRLVEIDRINQLLLIAEALPGLHGTAQAVRGFIDHMVDARGAAPTAGRNDDQRLDSWSLTLAESARMQAFARQLANSVQALLPQTGAAATAVDGATLTTLLDAAAASACAGSAPAPRTKLNALTAPAGFVSNRALLQRLLQGVIAYLADGTDTAAATGISITSVPAADAVVLQFSAGANSCRHHILSGSSAAAIPASYAELLLAYLLCGHLGGSLQLDMRATPPALVLRLPVTAAAAAPALDLATWHEDLLLRFEPEIQA